MTFWKKKCLNLLKIAEIFAIFENSNVDTVAAWFDRQNIGRPNSRLSILVYSKCFFFKDTLVKKKLKKTYPPEGLFWGGRGSKYRSYIARTIIYTCFTLPYLSTWCPPPRKLLEGLRTGQFFIVSPLIRWPKFVKSKIL